MKIPTHKEFIDYIKAHLEANNERPSTFGRLATGDPGAIIRLFKGTDPRLSTMTKIIKCIEDKNDATRT